MSRAATFWKVTRWARATRFWVLLALAALGALGFGEARADVHPTRGEAHTHCMTMANTYTNAVNGNPAFANNPDIPLTSECVVASNRYREQWRTAQGTTGGWFRSGDVNHGWVADCPPNSGEWNDDLKRCFDPDECLQRNGAANGMPAIETARPFSERCVAGCQLKMEGPGSCTSIVGQAGSKMCSGVFQYSGNACSAEPPGDPNEPPPPPESDETCTPVASGGGLQVCKGKNGQECVSTKSGASICWGTHETGEKSIGNEQQARGPGNQEPTPTPPTPPETFDPAQKTPPVTTTTTTTNPNGSTTTTTTTTVSNGTTNGTTPPGTPAPIGGGGGGGGRGDDDEGDDGTASGGGDCDTPPVTTGDAVTGMVATQAWATRCAVEAGNAAKVTGDVGDCSAPFTVEGENANAEQLRALRASICGPEETARHDVESMKSAADDHDAAIAVAEAEFGESVLIESGDLPAISTTRYGGGGGCPVISIAMPWGATWSPPAAFCDVVAALRLLFLAIATIWAIRIIGEQ